METFNNIILNEMIVHGDASIASNPSYDETYIFAYKKDIWVISDKNMKRSVIEISTVLNELFYTIYDIQEWIINGSSEAFFGFVRGDCVEQYTGSQFTLSKTAPVIKKMMKKLKFRKMLKPGHNHVTWDDVELEVSNKEIQKPLKNQKFYHGTSIKYLEGIMKTGLRPHSENTSFGDIIHKDKIFVTTNKMKAYFHAQNSGNTNNSFPLILEFKIPNPDLLVSDFDVVVQLLGANSKESKNLGYDKVAKKAGFKLSNVNINDFEERYGHKTGGLSTKFGIFGYKGNIMPKFLERIIIDIDGMLETVGPTVYNNPESYFDFDLISDQQLEFGPIPSEVNFWKRGKLKGFIEKMHHEWKLKMEDYEYDMAQQAEDDEYYN